jgi:hypothetical protein
MTKVAAALATVQAEEDAEDAEEAKLTSRKARHRNKKNKSTPSSPKPKAAPAAKATPRASTTSRRRAQQKDRVRALRTAAGLPEPALQEPLATALREHLRTILAALQGADTICPSRVPRALVAAEPETYSDWTALIPATRAVVWEAAEKGDARVIVEGEVVPAGEKRVGAMRVARGE